MRRILVLVASLGVLPAAVGCHHTAGVCDCRPPVNACSKYGLYSGEAAVPVAPTNIVHETKIAETAPAAMPASLPTATNGL